MDDREAYTAVHKGLIEGKTAADFDAVHDIAMDYIGSERDFTTDRRIDAMKLVYGISLRQMASEQGGVARIEVFVEDLGIRAQRDPNFGRLAMTGLAHASTLLKDANPLLAKSLHAIAQDILKITAKNELQLMNAEADDGPAPAQH